MSIDLVYQSSEIHEPVVLLNMISDYYQILNLVMVKKTGVLRTLLAVPDLFSGNLLRHKNLIATDVSKFIEISFPPGAPYHLDGEDFTGDGTLKISVLHHALSVKAPKCGKPAKQAVNL